MAPPAGYGYPPPPGGPVYGQPGPYNTQGYPDPEQPVPSAPPMYDEKQGLLTK